MFAGDGVPTLSLNANLTKTLYNNCLINHNHYFDWISMTFITIGIFTWWMDFDRLPRISSFPPFPKMSWSLWRPLKAKIWKWFTFPNKYNCKQPVMSIYMCTDHRMLRFAKPYQEPVMAIRVSALTCHIYHQDHLAIKLGELHLNKGCDYWYYIILNMWMWVVEEKNSDIWDLRDKDLQSDTSF